MALEIMIAPATLTGINQRIKETHELKKYRPIVVLILKNGNGHYLVVQSAKNKDWWGFPQGGVNQGEDVIVAIFRELFEETRIERQHIKSIQYLGTNKIDIQNWENRDGFETGKVYHYFFLSGCEHYVPVIVQRKELSNYLWLTADEVQNQLSTVNTEKKDLLLRALSQAEKVNSS